MNEQEVLEVEIKEALEIISQQIEDAKAQIKNRVSQDINPYIVQDRHGNYILSPMLSTKATLLTALVVLGNSGGTKENG